MSVTAAANGWRALPFCVIKPISAAASAELRETTPDSGVRNNDGRTMFDMVWTRNRQERLVPNPLREQWVEIGMTIGPLAEEL